MAGSGYLLNVMHIPNAWYFLKTINKDVLKSIAFSVDRLRPVVNWICIKMLKAFLRGNGWLQLKIKS